MQTLANAHGNELCFLLFHSMMERGAVWKRSMRALVMNAGARGCRSIRWAAAICLFLVSCAVGAASGSENVVVLNIEPSPENPRNSEGAFTALPSGRGGR